MLATLALTLGTARALAAVPAEINYDEAKVPPYVLPDPLAAADGTRLTTPDAWLRVGRPATLDLLSQHVYGRRPDVPLTRRFSVTEHDAQAMQGKALRKRIDITVSCADRSLTFPLHLFTPSGTGQPAPVFLLICNRGRENIDPTREKKSPFWPAEEIVARGYGAATFFNGDLDPDQHDGFANGVHAVLEPPAARTAESWGTLSAWAWGASWALDYLETDADVDAKHVAVVGHSRGGKTALWAGATDPRFALVVANDSGCGGAALSRRIYGETVARITTAFPHWFCARFATYAGREADLPVDQHMLIALLAPRAVYVASAAEDRWADPKGEFLSLVHAAPVYALFGRTGLGTQTMPPVGQPVHGDGMAYHIRPGQHNLTLFDWQRFMDFADRTWARR